MVKSISRIIAQGMLRQGTPVEDYRKEYGIWVKREDRACLPPGPPFSKTRGVYARVASRPEGIIGVLDTYHSQAGHAVARACQVLGKKCINFYPEFKHEPGYREPQARAQALGADLIGLKAGRSAILYHAMKRQTEEMGGYAMPNALKLYESVSETALECLPYHLNGLDGTSLDMVIIPASSGTLASGVIKGLGSAPVYIVHMGYSRSHEEVRNYIREGSGVPDASITLVDEGYGYKDQARPGPTPPWPCNPYYDLKAFRWWMRVRDHYRGMKVLFWNIG